MKSLSTSGAFGMGVFAFPIDPKPIGKTDEILQKRYEETRARLQKIENAGYTVHWISGCEFRKLARKCWT
jgi:hypothetical protein